MPIGISTDPLVILPGPGRPKVPFSLIHSPTTLTPPLPTMQFPPSHCIHERCPLEGCPHTNAWLDGPLALPIEMQHPSIADFCLPLPLPSSLYPGLEALLPSGRPRMSYGYSRPGLEVTEELSDRTAEMEEILTRFGKDKENEADDPGGSVGEISELPASQETVRNEPTINCEIPPEERLRHMYRPRTNVSGDALACSSVAPASDTSIRIASWIESCSQSQDPTALPIVQEPSQPSTTTVLKKTKSGSLRVQTDLPISPRDALDSAGIPLPPELVISLAVAKVVVTAAASPTPQSPPTPSKRARSQAQQLVSSRMEANAALDIVLGKKVAVKPSPRIPNSSQSADKGAGKSQTDHPVRSHTSPTVPRQLSRPTIATSPVTSGPTANGNGKRSGPRGVRGPAKGSPVPSSLGSSTPPLDAATDAESTESSKRTSSPAASATPIDRSSFSKASPPTKSTDPAVLEETLATHYNGPLPTSFDVSRSVTPSPVEEAPMLLHVSTKHTDTHSANLKQRHRVPYPSPRRTGSESGDESSEDRQVSEYEMVPLPRHDPEEESTAKPKIRSNVSETASNSSQFESMEEAERNFKEGMPTVPPVASEGKSGNQDAHTRLHTLAGDDFEIWNDGADRAFDGHSDASESSQIPRVARGSVHRHRTSTSSPISIQQLVSNDTLLNGRDNAYSDTVKKQEGDDDWPPRSMRYKSEEEVRDELLLATRKAFKAGYYERMVSTVDDKAAVLRVLELEAEARAKGKSVEFTLNPEILKPSRGVNQGPISGVPNGKNRKRAKEEMADREAQHQAIPDPPAEDIDEVPSSDPTSPPSPLRPLRSRGKAPGPSHEKQKTNAMALPTDGLAEPLVDHFATNGRGRRQLSRIDSSVTEKSDADVSFTGLQTARKGVTAVKPRSFKSSFVAPKPVRPSSGGTGSKSTKAVRSKTVGLTSEQDASDEKPRPAKKPRLDHHSSTHDLLWASVRAKHESQPPASEGSGEVPHSDKYTDRDAEGSPDPLANDEDDLQTPSKKIAGFVVGSWERTRLASRNSKHNTAPSAREPSEDVEEGPSHRVIPVRAAQAVGRAKTAKAFQMPFPNMKDKEPNHQPKRPPRKVHRQSYEHVNAYTDAEDAIILDIVNKQGTGIKALEACVQALTNAGFKTRSTGALGWRLRNTLKSSTTLAE